MSVLCHALSSVSVFNTTIVRISLWVPSPFSPWFWHHSSSGVYASGKNTSTHTKGTDTNPDRSIPHNNTVRQKAEFSVINATQFQGKFVWTVKRELVLPGEWGWVTMLWESSTKKKKMSLSSCDMCYFFCYTTCLLAHRNLLPQSTHQVPVSTCSKLECSEMQLKWVGSTHTSRLRIWDTSWRR